MKLLTILLTLTFAGIIWGQAATPTYTTNYNFRKYADGENPTADSLNANWDEIDTQVKVNADSSVAATRVNTFGDQTIAGAKTFTYGVTLSDVIHYTAGADTAEVNLVLDGNSNSYKIGGSTVDTLASFTVTDAIDGDVIYLIYSSGAGSITFPDALSEFQLAGGANFTASLYDTIVLLFYNSIWCELSRSNN